MCLERVCREKWVERYERETTNTERRQEEYRKEEVKTYKIVMVKRTQSTTHRDTNRNKQVINIDIDIDKRQRDNNIEKRQTDRQTDKDRDRVINDNIFDIACYVL